jgi:hypothetical protein
MGVQTLEHKPDLAEAARRWEAYFAGEILDRPVVCVTAPLEGAEPVPGVTYRDRAFGDPDDIIGRQLRAAAGTFFGGEAIPTLWLSFGPDEIAAFCGAELRWSEDSGDTNWSVPCVDDWEAALPIRLDQAHPLFRRMMALYARAADLIAGKMVAGMLDLHTNMDLVAALRGPQRLCADLLDRPEAIDRAMADARAVFPRLWDTVWEAGRLDAVGYGPCTTLQCDFSCMVSPAMFRRWILPALEEEAEVVGNAVYHWDGPGALVHTEDLIASPGLHTLSYVPGDGRGTHSDYLDLYRHVQAGGKAVAVWGGPDEIRAIHKQLRPDKTMYSTWTASRAEAEELLEWFVRNT